MTTLWTQAIMFDSMIISAPAKRHGPYPILGLMRSSGGTMGSVRFSSILNTAWGLLNLERHESGKGTSSS